MKKTAAVIFKLFLIVNFGYVVQGMAIEPVIEEGPVEVCAELRAMAVEWRAKATLAMKEFQRFDHNDSEVKKTGEHRRVQQRALILNRIAEGMEVNHENFCVPSNYSEPLPLNE